MLFKNIVALLAIGASALPEAIPQAGTRTTTTTRTVTSTPPARTVTSFRTITTCSNPPRTVTTTRTATSTTCTQRPSTLTRTTTRPASTITRPASTVTRPASTVTRPASTITRPASTITRPASTVTRTVTFTATPPAAKPTAYLEVIIHPDPLCGTKPVQQNYQNPADDQITVPVLVSGSICRDTKKTVSSFSFTRLNAASFGRGCRLYYYSEQGCQNPINDGTSLNNENKCVNLPYDKMQSFQVSCT